MKYLVAGLGNPGQEYELTRHNIGFLAVDCVAGKFDVPFQNGKLAQTALVKYKGRQIYLIKPFTYMNLSGKAINYWMQQLDIPKENLLVIADDLAIPYEKLRLRAKGSNAGHNGLASIEAYLGTEYSRLRVGIGNNFPKGRQVDYVLSRFTNEEVKLLPDILEKSANAALSFCTIGLAQTMNHFNF